MADLGLYENFLEHAIREEALSYRRTTARVRNMEISFEMPDRDFMALYRLNKSLTLELIQELEPYLPRKRGLTTVCKVLSALSFYASGSYQRYVGANAHHMMHQVSVSNCLRAVTLALNNDHFRRKYIHFPRTREERNGIKQGFFEKFGMPGVVGCVDGTHIAIVRPAEFDERHYNRKRYFSLNAQIICDSDLNIISIDASHGGASHDSYIWNNHPIKDHLEHLCNTESERVWLLSDQGYPLRATLLTPIVNTEPNSPERYYTDLHCKVRNSVERTIGVLKSRWRCLLVDRKLRCLLVDRKLHYHPIMAGYIANACVVLHNIANKARLPVPDLTEEEEERLRNELAMQQELHITYQENGGNPLNIAQTIRNALLQRLWLQAARQGRQ